MKEEIVRREQLAMKDNGEKQIQKRKKKNKKIQPIQQNHNQQNFPWGFENWK